MQGTRAIAHPDDCYEKVINYGIAFYGKSCKVKKGETVYAPEE